eukprot:CAMPEP_0198328602 /NCGR_PEP_ID=MMETSP1450-20131203/15576_1 /TAXON_ID=753684 ORGANISM="Madagascaria erythrocladiodes, Strain CCMP3234" /NCGR_SAMPLE_ID=MMETSP1450 /ASSEMBLY_ACC=CAM_ASM_001115 /LENGTH=245 /DNA_ID=CAMNT_0044032745 /DNA_START=37 /DNA_END=774 /DNA_ORIENTATION=-
MAFLAPGLATGRTSAATGGLSARSRGVRRAVSRRPATVVAQYNYNIYQDGSERSKRGVSAGERAVTIRKPLGLVLEEANDGMVFIAEINQQGNAAAIGDGQINVGDVVVACSATFGDEVWSTRGIGLERVLKSIAVRSGDFVTLVLETPSELADRKAAAAAGAAQRRVDARDKFGEREVLDPTSWASSAPKQYDDQYSAQETDIDSALKEKLKQEVVAPYKQNWILWASIGVGFLVIASVLILGS